METGKHYSLELKRLLAPFAGPPFAGPQPPVLAYQLSPDPGLRSNCSFIEGDSRPAQPCWIPSMLVPVLQFFDVRTVYRLIVIPWWGPCQNGGV